MMANANIMKALLITVLAVLVTEISSQSSAEQRAKAAENSAKILTDLYITLRNIAFPQSPITTTEDVENRFVLLSPGRVLNYWDYYPGSEYEESLSNRNNSAKEVLIPPSVMEKWFDIADVVVGGDPFRGGVTGKSLARIYETILAGMDVLGFAAKTSEAQTRYNIAQTFLTSMIQDPEDANAGNISRLSLYERYKAQYAEYQLEMEDTWM